MLRIGSAWVFAAGMGVWGCGTSSPTDSDETVTGDTSHGSDAESEAAGDDASSGGVTGGSAAEDGSEAGDTTGVEEDLTLDVLVTDGECTDLSRTDRDTYALRFEVDGPPNALVDLWASKPECDADPFVYQSIETDDGGFGFFELHHDGSDACHESLLGGWTVWVEHDGLTSEETAVVFRNATCEGAQECAAASTFCPGPELLPPFIPKEELFVLSDEERTIFTPPPEWLDFGGGYESWPLERLWNAFDTGTYPLPLDPNAGPSGWLEPDGSGSQNHALLWIGVAALGHGLAGDVEQYEIAAEHCLTLLSLDTLQGHMRHEAVGQYAGFWEGGIATMALAGLYAPEGSTLGPALLEAARAWWNDHIAVLRALSVPDGQVTLIGARLPGVAGEEDSWSSLSAAINLQLIDPRPHETLHPTIAQFLTPNGEPVAVDGGVPVRWYRPRHVSERWVVLRAVQSGALLPVSISHPVPAITQRVYRWENGGVVHTATPEVIGFRPARWQVRWEAGAVIETEVGDPGDTPHTGKGPHAPPQAVVIPPTAEQILGD